MPLFPAARLGVLHVRRRPSPSGPTALTMASLWGGYRVQYSGKKRQSGEAETADQTARAESSNIVVQPIRHPGTSREQCDAQSDRERTCRESASGARRARQPQPDAHGRSDQRDYSCDDLRDQCAPISQYHFSVAPGATL